MSTINRSNEIGCPVVRGMYETDAKLRAEADAHNGRVGIGFLAERISADLHVSKQFAYAGALTAILPGEGLTHWMRNAFTMSVDLFNLNTPAVGGINHAGNDTGMTTFNKDGSFSQAMFDGSVGRVAVTDPDGVKRIHINADTINALVEGDLARGTVNTPGSAFKAALENPGEFAAAMAVLARRSADGKELVVDKDDALRFFRDGIVPAYTKDRTDADQAVLVNTLKLALMPTIEMGAEGLAQDLGNLVAKVKAKYSAAVVGIEHALGLETPKDAGVATARTGMGKGVCPFMQNLNQLTPDAAATAKAHEKI